MDKFLIMCVVLYLINKVAYWHEDRKEQRSRCSEHGSVMPDPCKSKQANSKRESAS